MTEHSSNTLAVIDATDATVLPPEGEATVLTQHQTEELDKCQFHLNRLGRRIAAREVDLIYFYVEAGWWLMRAKQVHRAETVSGRSDGRFVAQEETGFFRWLESQDLGISDRTARNWMQGARNAGLTPESSILALQTIKAEKQLHGRTLTDICRKPVDKEDKEAEVYEVTDAEREAEEQEERNSFWDNITAQIHARGIEADEWAKLDPERRAGLHDLSNELAKRIKPSLKKGKPSPALPEIVPPAPKTAASESLPWRVGQRTGQSRWQIKHAPGWGVTHEVESLEAAAAWLRDQDVDLNTVAVLTTSPWPTLTEHLKTVEPEPITFPDESDPIWTQSDSDRGMWWYGYRNPYGRIIAHSWHGDMEQVLEARRDPRVIVIGPFFASSQEAAEARIRHGVAGQQSAVELHDSQKD